MMTNPDDVYDMCVSILDDCEELDDSDFRDSVVEYITDIRDQVDTLNRFSERQLDSVLEYRKAVNKMIGKGV